MSKIMERINIKNFGSIANAEVAIKKVVVLIGENAIGKSTIIKLISTFLWIEKALFRGSDKKWFEKENRLKNSLLPYHRIENFLTKDSVIEYTGKVYILKYSNDKITVEKQENNNYQLPQIMYVPAERNFLTYLRTTKDFKSEGALQDFEREYYNAANNLKRALSLPVQNFKVEYSKRHEMLYVKNKTHKIKVTEAASGLQSSVPLYLVSDYLSKLVQNKDSHDAMTSGDIRKFQGEITSILNDNNLSDKQKHIAISTLSSKFNKKAFINIVEEPEQNLFPVSQMHLIKSLVSICNQNEDNKLIISTHSPYVLATINNLIIANKAGKKEPDKVTSKIPKHSWLNCKDVFAGIVHAGSVLPIMDAEFDIIQMEQIDSVSRVINEEFDFLYNLETENDAEL
jgi:predicted ATP-dependent endonuclease of OLD family